MKVSIPKRDLKWAWYWMTCYECPDDPSCTDKKPCKNCKQHNEAMESFKKVT